MFKSYFACDVAVKNKSVSVTFARTGIQVYAGSEIGIDAPTVRLYRPAEEVFSQDAMKSYEGVPVGFDHPQELITKDTEPAFRIGSLTNVLKASDKLLGGRITLDNSTDADSIVGAEVSLGYTFTLDMTPGVSPEGEAYDGIMREIRANHLAIVKRGRCGPICKVGDSKVKKFKIGDKEYEVSDELHASLEAFTEAKSVALMSAIDAAKAENKALIAAKDEEISALKAKVPTPEGLDKMANDRAELITEVRKHLPEYQFAGKDCEQVRRDTIKELVTKDAAVKRVVEAMGFDAEKADLSTVKMVFAAAVSSATEVEKVDSAIGDSIIGDKETTESVVGYDSLINLQANAWKGTK